MMMMMQNDDADGYDDALTVDCRTSHYDFVVRVAGGLTSAEWIPSHEWVGIRGTSEYLVAQCFSCTLEYYTATTYSSFGTIQKVSSPRNLAQHPAQQNVHGTNRIV